MPKRTNEEKIRHHRRKLRKLEENHRKYRRIVYSSSDSNNSDNEEAEEPNAKPLASHQTIPKGTLYNEISVTAVTNESVSELDPVILSALGKDTKETSKFGPKIHTNLSQLWSPILKKGLNKYDKYRLTEKYPIPSNCQLLQASTLNPEVLAAIPYFTRGRDKRAEALQQQLGEGITALNKGLEILLNDNTNKLQAIKHLSDSCRILCDLHHTKTNARKRNIVPRMDKAVRNIIPDDDNRDDFVFGKNLSRSINAAQEKRGSQFKKPSARTNPFCEPSNSRSRRRRPPSSHMPPVSRERTAGPNRGVAPTCQRPKRGTRRNQK